MKKVLSIFARDLKIASGDFMALYIGIVPLILAVVIVILSPGIRDSSLKLAMHRSIDTQHIESMRKFAKVTVYDSVKDVEERVLRRDEVIGMVKKEHEVELIAQGNESEDSVKMAKFLNSLYELDSIVTADNESRMKLYTFNQKMPPLKRTFSVALLLMIPILSAIITALGLVDEKADRTIKAANVTPMSQTSYVLSKSIIGIISLIVTSVLSLMILGMWQINWTQMLIIILANGLLSIIIAFIIGLASTDFIEVAGSIKVLLLPMVASVLVYQLASEKWHWTVMWSPFYWANRSMVEIINQTASWSDILKHTSIIIVICLIVFKLCTKRIRKSLN